MSSPSGTPRFDYEIHIGAPVARVWHALADGEMTPHYAFGTRFEGRLVKGAPYAFIADGAFRAVDGEILDLQPERRLVMSWRAHWDPAVEHDPPSRVTYELESTSPLTTRLRLTHDQFACDSATHTGSAASWPLMLSSLKTLLESGTPFPAT